MTQPLHIGPYVLDKAIGHGGMGEIWRATHGDTGARVAIKRILVASGDDNDELCARLLREAEALHRLRHDHVVSALESGLDTEGQPYIVLEWLEGEDLSRRAAREPLRIDETLELCRQALLGLEYIHGQGVVHRDLKPANLFLVGAPLRPRVKIVDFGLALLGDDATRLTRDGQVLGTLHYLSPEQARGRADVDHRADVYAMGVILYRLTTGRVPFHGDNPVAILLKIVTENPVPPRELRPDLPAPLEALILRAMARPPSDRFASAKELRLALEALPSVTLRGMPVPPPIDGDAATRPQLAPTPSGEHRLVSLLCVQPGKAAPDLEAITRQAVEGLDAQLQTLLGGRVIVLFGLERTQGDEALKAVRAGLAVRDATGAAAPRLLAATVHLDVRRGLRLEAEELDRALAELPRLPPGQLVIDAATRQLVESRVVVRQEGPHRMVLELSGNNQGRRRVLGIDTPMVGRETELATLRAAFDRVERNGESGAALLLGAPGEGKSRLLGELRDELASRCALLLEARGDPSCATISLGLLRDALRRHAGLGLGLALDEQRRMLERFVTGVTTTPRARDAVPFLGETLGIPFEETPSLRVAREDPRLMRERVAQAFLALLGEAARERPVALCLDDLQWADPDSLALCERLLEQLDRCPVFLVGTARPELLERRPDLFKSVEPTRVELKGLGRRPVRRLLRALLQGEANPALEELIATWSDGNPHFIEELLAWLVSHDALVPTATGWTLQGDARSLALPVGIEGAIQARLDPLPSRLKEVLKAAAVFGETFWESGLELLGFPEAAHLLEELAGEDHVHRRPQSRFAGTVEWSFRHVLTRQVAYGFLLPEDRRSLHRLGARWLEVSGETDAAVLAQHFARAGELRQAGSYYAKAAARSLIDGQAERAIEWYRASLSDELTPHELLERRIGLGRALVPLGRYDEAWQALEPFGPLPPAAEWEQRQADLAVLRGRILRGQRRFAEAEAGLTSALATLPAKAYPEARFELLHTLFWCLWELGRYGDAGAIANRLFTEAVEDRRPSRLGAAQLAMSYHCTIDGDLSHAVEFAAEAVRCARLDGHLYREADGLVMLGSLQEMVGLLSEAQASLQEALSLAARLKSTYYQAMLAVSLSRVEVAQGTREPALAHAREAVAFARRLGDTRTEAMALNALASVLAASGGAEASDEALREVTRALELCRERYPVLELEAHAVTIELELARGENARALAHAEPARRLLDQLGGHEQSEVQILLALHAALSAAGQADEALSILRRAWRTLRARARRIGNDAVRQSYLALPANARLKTLWEGTRENPSP